MKLQVPYLLPCNKQQFPHVLIIACLVPANLFMPCLMEVHNSLQAACIKLRMHGTPSLRAQAYSAAPSQNAYSDLETSSAQSHELT